MSGSQSILKDVKPRLMSLVDEFVAMGAERYAVIYMIEKESTRLRDAVIMERKDAAASPQEGPSSGAPVGGRVEG